MKKIIAALFAIAFAASAFAAPAAITTLKVVSTNGASAVLSCTVPSANVTKIEFRYRTTVINAMTYASSTVGTTLNSPGPQGTVVTVTVTGLSPNTTYYFAAKAFDTAWCASISNVPNGVTLGSTKTIQVYWTLSDDGGTMPSAFYVVYGPTPDMPNGPVIVSGTTYSTNINVPWGPCYVQVLSWNGNGSTPASVMYSPE